MNKFTKALLGLFVCILSGCESTPEGKVIPSENNRIWITPEYSSDEHDGTQFIYVSDDTPKDTEFRLPKTK